MNVYESAILAYRNTISSPIPAVIYDPDPGVP